MIKASSKLSAISTVGAFLNGRACSDTLFHVLSRAFDHPLKPEELAVAPLAGGIKQNGYQCGMLWGATLAAGAQAFRLFGPGPQTEAKAILAAQRLVESFRAGNNYIDCYDITETGRPSTQGSMIWLIGF